MRLGPMPPCHDCSELDLAGVQPADICLDRLRDSVLAGQMANEILDAFHYACDARDADTAGNLLDALRALLRDLPGDTPLRRGMAAAVWREAMARLQTIRDSR